jgi:hypothetical protein
MLAFHLAHHLRADADQPALRMIESAIRAMTTYKARS